MTKPISTRIEGLDMARFFALAGMVIVNFNIVMVETPTPSLASLLQGRAAALFVVLAGIGLGLSARKNLPKTRWVTLKRAVFLLLVGLLNMLIFPADILHYYAFYFVFAIWFLRAPQWVLWSAMGALVFGFLIMVLTMDFDAGWDWQTYNYAGFWTVNGFARNLFFNGWHPVAPWLAFLIFGLWLSRLKLGSKKTQWKLLGLGTGGFAMCLSVSKMLVSLTVDSDAELALLFSTAPVPPLPLYMCAGASFSCMVIGGCLLFEARLRTLKILPLFTVTGRQTLTLYIAHIVIGMGALEALGMLETQSACTSLWASAIFCSLSIIYALLWRRFFKYGPIEYVMRKLT